MEHAHNEASLVDYRRPRRLSPLAGGSSAFAFNSHELAWPEPALSQSISSASSAGQSSSSSQYSSPASYRSDRGYELEASASFVQQRYPTQTYDQQLSCSEMEAGFEARLTDGSADSVMLRRVPRQELLTFEKGHPAFQHHVIDDPTRDNSPEPGTSQYYSVMRPPPPERLVKRSARYSPYYRVPTDGSSSLARSNQRSNSPASSSSASEAAPSGCLQRSVPTQLPHTMPVGIPTPRQKHQKQRLYTVDRRNICIFAQENPKLRQEDIAKRFNVERSTVSKILKEKSRWLLAPEDPGVFVAKYRMPKYNQIEVKMVPWLDEQSKEKVVLTDAMIRDKALEVAVEAGADYRKFKASPGWVENFKARLGIRKGVWHGNGMKRDIDLAFALGAGAQPPPSPTARPKRVDVYKEQPTAITFVDGVAHYEVTSPSGEKRMVPLPGLHNHTPPGYNKRGINGNFSDDDQDGMEGMDETDEMDGMDGMENPGGMGNVDTMPPAAGEARSAYQPLPVPDYQTQHETGWQPATAPAPVYVQSVTNHDGHTGSLGLINPSIPHELAPAAVDRSSISHANYTEPTQQEHYVPQDRPAHSDNAHVEPLEELDHLPFPPFSQDELPDYVKCVDVVVKLCGKDDFKAFASLTQYDYGVLDNLVKAVHAYTKGQSYTRVS